MSRKSEKSTTTSSNSSKIGRSKFRLIGRISFVFILLVSAATFASSSSAASFAYLDSVKEFLGISAPASGDLTAMDPMAAAPMMAGSLLTPPMTGAIVGCNQINVSWTNANASNTYGDLYRVEAATFPLSGGEILANRLAHFEGNDRLLLAGSVTYPDAAGIVFGHTYSYRVVVVKTSGGGSTEFLDLNGITVPTTNCLTTTTTAPSATPASFAVGTGGTVALSATISKLSGTSTANITGTLNFVILDPSLVTITTVPGTFTSGFPATATATMNKSVVNSVAGTYTVRAEYSGDGNYNASQATTPINVGLSSSTTTVATSGSPSVYGSSVTFTATVNPVGPPTPAGTVIFYDSSSCGGAQIGTATLNGSRQAAVSTSALTAGTHTISACYQGNGSYGASSGTVSQTVNVKPLTLNGVTASNKVYDGNTSATISFAGASLSGIVGGDTVSFSTAGASGAFASANVGTGITVNVSGVTLTGINSSNYSLTPPTTSANITQATLTYNATPASRQYGVVNPTFAGTVTGFVGTDTQANATTGTLTFTSPATQFSNVGSYAINGSGLTANNSNYTFVQAGGNATALTITAAALTYNADTVSRAYGVANPAFTGTVTGFLGTDTQANATTGTLAFTSAATQFSNVGSYAINGSGLTANNGNYTFVQAGGNATALTITAATLTYNANTVSRAYGVANPAFTGTVTGFLGTDTQANATTGTLAFTSAATQFSNAGSYAINGSGLTANNGNYTFVQAGSNATALTITAATLTYNANTVSRAYGVANPAFTGTVTGFLGTDTQANATTGTLSFSSPAGQFSNVGSYAINGSGLTANNGNYTFVQAGGNATALTITAATLTYVATPASRQYGVVNPSFAGTVTGFLGTDTQANATTGTLTFTSPAGQFSNVGSYAINGSGLTANNGNYTFAQAGGNATALTITAATLTYVATPASRQYGVVNPSFAGTVTGFLGTDTQANATTGTLSFTSPAGQFSNVGSYPINGSGLAANNGNYTFVQAGGNATALTITAATLTYVADPVSRQYGVVNPTFTGTVTGFLGTDTQANATTGTLSFTSTAGQFSNVGSYAINGSGLAANNGNYTFVQAGGNATALTITAATLTYVADPVSRQYGLVNPAFTGTVTGFLGTDTQANATTGTLSFSSPAGQFSNVGSYAINGSGLTANNGNYVFVQAGGNATALTITAATLTYNANTASRAYGVANPTFTGTVTGFLGTDTQANATTGTLTFTSPAGQFSNVGSYAINGSGLTANNGNYVFVQAGGNATALTITAATLTYVATPASRMYGVVNPTFAGTVTGFLGTDTQANATTGTLSFTSPAGQFSNVGSYPINGSGLTANNGNYIFVQAAGNATALTITTANQTINFAQLPDKNFGDADFMISATATSGLTVTFTSTTPSKCTMVGADTVHIVTSGTCTIQANQAGDSNYNPAPAVNNTFTIGFCPILSTLPDINTPSGVDIDIPVSISNVTGGGIIGVDFVYSYDPTKLTPVYAGGMDPTVVTTTAGPVASAASASILANEFPNLGSGNIAVSVYGSTDLTGAGVLVYIRMHVTASAVDSTPLTLSDNKFNGGSVCSEGMTGILHIVQANTTTTVTSNNNPSVYGQNVTFTATIGSTPTASAGSVQFVIDGNPFAGCTAVPVISGIATCSTAALNAGTHTVVANYTGTVNFANSSGTLSGGQAVGKANAVVVVNPYNVTYNGLPHSATVVSITGVNGETGATVGTVDVSNTAHTNAGTYNADFWFFTGTANYNNIGNTTITDVINKADATFTVTPYTVTYDGLSHTASVSTITGVNGETGATVGTVNVANTTHTNAGTYSTDNWSFTGGPNYNNQGPTTITDIINKADATFTVTPYNVTYDGLSHTASVSTITGVNGETGATVGTVNVANTTHTNAGTYNADFWFFTGTANYNNIGNTTITDVINKANATVVVTPYNVNYDGTSHTAAITSITGVNGETGATVGTVDVSNTAHTNAGTYNADFWFFTGTANYNNIGNTTITDTINKANATVVVTPYNVTYDGMSHTAAVTSITGVNGETGATVGTVDVSNTTHTNAGNYPADFWTFTGTANYNNIGPTTITDVIGKATATCNVTPYSVPYDNMPHTATGQCNGVNGEMNLSTLDLSGTTHTAPGTYNDTWSFTSVSGNYFDQLNVPITNTIISGSVAGSVSYAIVPKPVPGVTLDAPGSIHVTGTTDSLGNYVLNNFGAGAYTITPSKPTQQCTPMNVTNGIFSNDASKVARYVVGLEPLSADQIQAGTVNGLSLPISSFDAALIAQKVVGICGNGGNRSGQWVFNPLSRSYMNVVGNITGDNYSAIMRGDVDGDWSPTGPNRPARPEGPEGIKNAIHMTVASGRADRGATVTVPVRIDNLRGSPVEAYQFDISYDPRVVTPDSIAADLTGTLSANMSVAYNVFEPGLLKVAVYGAYPASGDGVYVNLRFVATGASGSRSALHVDEFYVGNGTAPTYTYDGEIVVNGGGIKTGGGDVDGLVRTVDGSLIEGSQVNLINTEGKVVSTRSDVEGRFHFTGLTIGQVYTVTVNSARFRFQQQSVTVTEEPSVIELTALDRE